MLRRRVSDRAAVGPADSYQASHRAGQHGCAAALLDHDRNRDVDGVVNTREVDIDDVSPAVVACAHRRDPGIGNDDVEAAELVETGLQRFCQRPPIPNVGLVSDDARAGILDELDGGGQVVGVGHRIGHRVDLIAQVDRNDVGAL